jgi:NAD(P)-dependent dehydrogenase (short-subunit alcohol dehydrogenase family)
MPPCLEPKLDVLPAAQKQIWTKADVSAPAAVRVMFRRCGAAVRRDRCARQQCGIMKLAKIADSDDALFDRQTAINLKGGFNAMRRGRRAAWCEHHRSPRSQLNIAGLISRG